MLPGLSLPYALTLALLISASAACWCADLYVSPAGDDRGAGTRQKPWRRIAKANEVVQPGDTVVLLPGSYSGTIKPARSGEAGRPICYRADQRHRAVLDSGGKAKLPIELSGTNHVKIEGLHIAPGDGSWATIRESHHIWITDCRMEKAAPNCQPFGIYGCQHVWVVDNAFSKDQVSGNMCNVINCTGVVIEGNSFTRVGHCPLRLEQCQRVVVRSNCFHNPWGRNYELVASGKVLVEGNIVTEALDSAHSADSRAKNALEDSIVRLNRAFRNWHTPLNSPSYVPCTRRVWEPFRLVNTRIYHNTITDNLGYGWQLAGMNVSANVFANNIFLANDKHGGGVQLSISEGLSQDNQYHHNLIRGTRAGQKTIQFGSHLWTAEEANRKTKRRRGYWTEFEGNIDAAPRFVDGGSRNFTLRADSPCIDAGRPLTRTTAAGQGKALPVEDARWFFDGFGIEGERGDVIAIGTGDRAARIEKVEFNYYQPDTILLDRDAKWKAGDPVSLPWVGKAPDMGACEHGLRRRRPVALAKPSDAKPGDTIKFTAKLPELGVQSVEWDLADGGTADQLTASHTFRTAGHYPVRLRVRYEDGRTERDFAFVKIAGPADPRAPMLTVDFEDETLLEWGFRFKFYRQRSTGFERVSGGRRGEKCMHLFAERKGSILGCSLAPGEWDIDAYPFVRFAYRVPSGTPVGLCLEAFPSPEHGSSRVVIGGTRSRAHGPYPDTGTCELVDDGQWHETTLDVRAIRDHIKGLKHLRLFRFYTHQNATKGHHFWFDDFAILPAASHTGLGD